MKVFFPQNIKGGFLSDKVPIGPIDLSIAQLGGLGLGATISMAIFGALDEAGTDTVIAVLLVSPIAIGFLLVTFFNFSEMNLFEFIAKFIRTNFIDNPVKYQVNYKKMDPIDVHIKRLKKWKKEKKIKKKEWLKRNEIQDLEWIV